jgi:hypothetical protein
VLHKLRAPPVHRTLRTLVGPVARVAWAVALLSITTPVQAQVEPNDDLLLPHAISREDVELSGRYVRQWKQPDGTLVLLFNGGFEAQFGRRRLSSIDAVVWIAPRTQEVDGRKYYELTAYLADQAQVREPGGTITEDRVLLVSNIRTSGQVVKLQDAHSPESMEESELYRRAALDRERIEAGERPLSGLQEIVVARPEDALRPPPEPHPVIRFQLRNIEPATTASGESVFVSTGRVYFSRGGDPNAPVLEIQADNAVVFPAEGAASSILKAAEERDRERAPPALEGDSAAPPVEPRETPPAAPREGGPLMDVRARVRAVYLEGDVVLTLGERFVRAERLYFDFERDRALILDGVFRSEIPARNIPLYVRADEIRQLSAREFHAKRARVSTSEFHTPHYHVGATDVYLRDLTARDGSGDPTGALAGAYTLKNATLNVGGLPIGYWPYSTGRFEQSETLIRRLRTGYSGDFGGEIETAWYLFNLLGIPTPPGVDATLRADYFTRRGPGVGIDSDYLQEKYFGLFRSYYINDGGEDNLGKLRDNTPDSPNRGRILWRHRHYLPKDWEATIEFAYLSDPGFLEEYRKSEAFEGKEQETALYLKRARDTEAISLLANWRLPDFTTQTEHLPDFTYRRIGDTLGPVMSYSEGRVGVVRYRPDDRRFFDSRRLDNTGTTDSTFRTDARQELELPLKLGPINVVPFATVRGSYWDGQPLDEGGLWRGLGTYGIRSGTSLARTYDDVESELLDIHRVRHIIQPELAFWWSHSNTRSELITPFDYGVETIDDFYGMQVMLRQTWQTQRGEGERRRTVDLVTWNIEAGLFGDQPARNPLVPGGGESPGWASMIRPENSRARNYIASDVIYRLSDTTSLLYDFNFDLNDGKFDRHNLSIAVERLPRTAYVLGWRSAGDIDMGLVGGGFNYKVSEKHIWAARAYWDIDRGELGEFAVAYVRKLPRWYVSLNFEIDEVFDEFKVSISLWPEGIPEWTLGSRRFTGLGTSTGIRP